MPQYTPITPESLELFKTLVLSRTHIEESEYEKMNSLDSVLRPVFRDLYYGDIELAEAVLSGSVSDELKQPIVDQFNQVSGMKSAVEQISSALKEGTPVFCVASDDEHAVTALSINETANSVLDNKIDWLIQPKDLGQYSMHDSSVQALLSNNDIDDDEPFVIVALGMGSQQKNYQKEFTEKYPKAHWVVFDHHLYNVDYQIEFQKPNVSWVSPYTESELSEGKRPQVSSGYLYHLAMKSVLGKMRIQGVDIDALDKALNDAGVACNKLASVGADIRIMPITKPQVNAVSDLEGVLDIPSRSAWLDKEAVKELDEKIAYLTGGEMQEKAASVAGKVLAQIEMSNALVELLENGSTEGDPEYIKQALIEKVMENKSKPIEQDTINRLKVHYVHYKFNSTVSAIPSRLINEVMGRMSKVMSGVGSEIKSVLRELDSIQVIEFPNMGFVKPDDSLSKALFTERDWKGAFSMRDKQVQGLVMDDVVGQLSFYVRSKSPMGAMLSDIKKQFSDTFNISYNGTGFVSTLTFNTQHGQPITPEVQAVIFRKMEESAVRMANIRSTNPVVKVDPISVDILMKVNEITGASAYSYDDYQVKGVMEISPEMTVKVGEDLKRIEVEDLVRDDLWGTSSVSLKFDNSQRVIFPTRLVKSIHEDDYKGLLSVSQINKGVMIVNGYLPQAMLEQSNIISFETDLRAQKESMTEYYKNELNENKTKKLTRDEMVSAVKFISDPDIAFSDHEALTLAYLDKSNSDAFIVLDIEANDGGVAPQCFNIGMVSYTLKEGTGKVISASEYDSTKFDGTIRNAKALRNGSYLVNREIEGEKLSLIINEDDMAIPVKAEKLTNMSSAMVKELGMSAAEAEGIMLDFLGRYDRYITQAHNYLGYDLAGIAANFPTLYQDILKNVVSDSVLPARAFAIGQDNVMVSGLGLAGSKAAFVTTPGSRYNVIDKLRDADLKTFTFPDKKGETLLRVNGEDVYLIDAKTNSGSKLKVSRQALASKMVTNSAPQFGRSAKAGIAPLIKLATIYDVLKESASDARQNIPFDSMGVEVPGSVKEAFELFQEKANPAMSVQQNLSSLLRNYPSLKTTMDKLVEFPVHMQPEGLRDSMVRGVPEKTQKTQKFQKTLSSVPMRKLFEYNAEQFYKANEEAFSFGSEAWVYDIVLGYGDVKEMSPTMQKSIAKRTGIPLPMIEGVVNNTLRYMEKYGLSSLFVDETHNNVDLRGDDFQEGIVVSHLHVSKLTDPFAPRHDVTQVMDNLYPYTVGATIEALAKQAFVKNKPSYAVNGHEYKQLRAFDVEARGISDIDIGTKYLSLNIKKSASDSVVVRMPSITISEYESYSDDKKNELIEAVSGLVYTSLLRNSIGEKTSKITASLVKALCESKKTQERIELLNQLAPDINIDNTEKEKGLMNLLRDISKAVANDESINLPVNKFITTAEIDAFELAYEDILDVVKSRLDVDLSERLGEIKQALNLARNEYECLDLVRMHGSRAHEVNFESIMHKSLKSAITSTLKAYKLIDFELQAKLPAFACTMVTKKSDVTMALLEKASPFVFTSLLDEHIPSLRRSDDDFELTPQVELKR